METYLTTQEAIGCAGRLLDEHDPDITITEKVFSVMENIYTQMQVKKYIHMICQA